MKKATRITALALIIALSACGGSKNTEKEAQAFIERSSTYESQGQYRAAMIEIRNAINAAPENEDILIRYAEVLLKVGALRQATEILAAQEGTKTKVLLADAYLQMGKHISAQEALRQANENSYRAEDMLALEAKAQFLIGNQAEAIDSLRDIAQLSTSSLFTEQTLIELLVQTDKLEEALLLTSQSLTEHPDNAKLLYTSGRINYLIGDLLAAESSLNAALIQLPEADMLVGTKLRTLELLIKVATDAGKPTEALVYDRIIKDSNPDAFSARQQYQAAIEAASSGDLETAKGAFTDILTQFPNNQQAAMMLGLVNVEEGNVEAGETLLSENIDAETAPISLIQATALAQSEVGKVESALNVVERALLARPDDPTLLSLYGVLSLNVGKTQQGVTSLSKALQIEPKRSRLRLLLAQHYNNTAQPELALGHLRKAFAVNPTDWATTSYYIASLFAQQESNEIQDIKENLQTSYPNNLTSQWLIALINYRSGDISIAKGQLAKLYNTAKNSNQIVESYASLLEQTEDYNEAAQAWLVALNNNPEESQFLERAIRSKAKSNDLNQVIAWLIDNKANHKEAKLPIDAGLVQLYISANKQDDALSIAKNYTGNQQALAKRIRATAYLGKTLQMAQSQDFTQALYYAEEGLKNDPSSQQFTILAAQFDARLKSSDIALKRLDSFISSHDENLLVVNDKAKLLITAENEDKALSFLEPYWEKQPNSQIAKTYIALVKKLNPEKYETAVNNLLAAEPDNAGANLIKGDLMIANGNPEQAQFHYLNAVKANENLVPALNNLAWLMAQTTPSDALQYSQRAAQLEPSNPAILDTYGWILHLNGDKEQAVTILEKALSLAPSNIEIQEHLDQAR